MTTWKMSASQVDQIGYHYRFHPNQMSASQVDQIGYHHRAARQFFAAHPAIADRIGRDKIEAALAKHVAIKLESLYWRRRLPEFRQLLAYAKSHGLDSPEIRAWRRRSLMPDRLVRLKDRLRPIRR